MLTLDEATSAPDSKPERHAQVVREALMRGRTSLTIAHRMSTTEKTGHIIVLQKAGIAEIVTRRKLLKRGEAGSGNTQ